MQHVGLDALDYTMSEGYGPHPVEHCNCLKCVESCSQENCWHPEHNGSFKPGPDGACVCETCQKNRRRPLSFSGVWVLAASIILWSLLIGAIALASVRCR